MSTPKKSSTTKLTSGAGRWRVQDAKARFSEVVRDAQQRGPQRVTLHGRDAVVIVSAEQFDRMHRPILGSDIVTALSLSPLVDVPIERQSVKSKVRDIDL